MTICAIRLLAWALLQFTAGAVGALTMKQALDQAQQPVRMYPDQQLPALQAWNGSVSHDTLARTAIFSLNFPDQIFGYYNVAAFLGSARKYSDGDIVMAVPARAPEHFLAKLAAYDVVVYLLDMQTVQNAHGVSCYHFEGTPPSAAVPLAQVRYLMYQHWAQKYHRKASILISDFRDVFFQSNPFSYMDRMWGNYGGARLAVSLEFYPNKVIQRCPFNNGWVAECYGRVAAKAIGRHAVSCSGVTIGSRNAVLVYSYLQVRHLDPAVRRASVQAYLRARRLKDTDARAPGLSGNDRCFSKGMDQGLHNWLLWSGELRQVLGSPPTVFHQGEGPINTIGAFQGARTLLKLDLEEVGLVRLTPNATYTVHNWDGALSPVVHQYDRTKYNNFFNEQKQVIVGSRRHYEEKGKPFPYPPTGY